MKRRTILSMFIVPLILVMLVQALITYGAVIWSGGTVLLADNSVDILGQSVESKKIMLENNMIQKWSNVKEEKEQADSHLAALLQRENIGIEDFMTDEDLQNEFLHTMLPEFLLMLRANVVTGSFLIVGDPKLDQADYLYQGIYFRDVDPVTNPGGYSDVLMERGNSSFAHETGIPLDSFWTTNFHFGAPGEREKDRFYYEPYQTAVENPQLSYKNMGYWSEPFLLTGDDGTEAYEIITYSVPLVYEEVVYGVMGVEVSRNYLLKEIVGRQAERSDSQAFLLAKYEAAERRLIPLFYSGLLAERLNSLEQGIVLNETKYDSLYTVAGSDNSDQSAYLSLQQMHLYNSHTPFAADVWVIAGIEDYESLFGFSDEITINLMMGVVIAFLLGCIGIYIIATLITSPIRKLAEAIKASSGNQLADYRRSRIAEVDKLYEVIRHLTEKQKENEYILMEEKERYRIALQSSTDSLFSFDFRTDELEIFIVDQVQGMASVREVYSLTELLEESPLIAPEHRQMIVHMIEDTTTEVSAELRILLNAKEEYQWVLLKGIVINDEDGARSKIIGSIKNIDTEKRHELQRLEEQRLDFITGLLKREPGRRLIEAEINRAGKGCMVLLDIADFRKINEEYGMVLGDSILEEIGNIIRDRMTDDMTGMRIGGDEILLWFSGRSSAEVAPFVAALKKKVAGMYPGSTLSILISAGMGILADKPLTYDQLLARAKRDLFQEIQQSGRYLTSRELIKREKEINQISGITYSEKLSIVSQVFNFFDKGGALNTIMAVMLNKLGNYFGARAIRVTLIDRDFHAVYLNYQWQQASGEEERPEAKQVNQVKEKLNEIRYFSIEEYDRLADRVGDRVNPYSELAALSPGEIQFLFAPPPTEEEPAIGISVPMYDRECYIGSISFIQGQQRRWDDRDKNDLQEIVKIIESNISREKHDLASQAKSDFLSRMSHEIRTPMNAIIGMTTIALMEKEDIEKVTDCLTKIDQSSHYLLGLINHILDMSKIESGKMKLEMDSLNLRKLIAGVENMIVPQAESKKIHYRPTSTIMHEWVVGDELRLSQILVNLLGNAIKFTPVEGNIELTVEQKRVGENQTRVKFVVQDDGIGISPENAERIFLSFEQVENVGGKEFSGTGLGLSISNHLVHMMGGNIELRSNPGEGSRFYFTLTMADGRAVEKPGIETEKLAVSSLEGCRILLVEDNGLNVEIAETLLTAQGYVVEVALNGQEALDKFAENQPGYYDVILMDIRMPVMDGLEATKRIRQLERSDAGSVPIIAMTANAFDEDMKKSIECGMNGHLTKPIDMVQLNDTIRAILA